jgi:hypothetical protein
MPPSARVFRMMESAIGPYALKMVKKLHRRESKEGIRPRKRPLGLALQ